MAADKLDIDTASILDNPNERQVEFSGEVDAEELQFAVQYDVLEALSGDAPEVLRRGRGDPAALGL